MRVEGTLEGGEVPGGQRETSEGRGGPRGCPTGQRRF